MIQGMIEGTITQGWPVGARFWYQSKYSDTLVEGVVASYRISSYRNGEVVMVIESTNGASYYSSEIEIENLSEIRDKKLDDLGI
jgi:hypothetical protein